MSNIIDQLNWRYATKQFDKTAKLSQEELSILTESLRLAPSSYGLQPWGFVVVSDQGTRESLKAAAWGQSQVTDASELIVLSRLVDIDESFVDKYLADVADQRGVEVATLSDYRNMMVGSIKNMDKQQRQAWMDHQVYLALGVLLTTAATLKIDTCPMEGFDKSKFDEILGLQEKGLSSVVICPVGRRSADDIYAKAKKVRFHKQAVITHV